MVILFEKVMLAAAQVMGCRVGTGRLRRLLLDSGNCPLALRVEALSRASAPTGRCGSAWLRLPRCSNCW